LILIYFIWFQTYSTPEWQTDQFWLSEWMCAV